MPKRKAEEVPQQTTSPSRPRTRSTGPIAEMQPASSPVKKRRKALVTMKTTTRSTEDRGSYKENNTNNAVYVSHGSSRDELDFLGSSSSKRIFRHTTPAPSSLSTAKGTPRQIFDAVVITTPKSAFRTPTKLPDHVPNSPSPSKVRPAGKMATVVPTNNDRVHPKIPLFPGRSPVSIDISSNSSPARRLPLSSKTAAAIQRLPQSLPSHLVPHHYSQKKAIMHALQHPPLVENESSLHRTVFNQLTELVKGTTERNEGNSCLILGPRGSGKSRLVDSVLTSVVSTSSNTPVVVRLSAYCQTNDRLAMREIARQVRQQIGSNFSSSLLPKDDEQYSSFGADDSRIDMELPPPPHLPGMIAALPELGRPAIIVLDGFDGFATHPRQALLYCLLDTAQSCRGGPISVETDHEVVDPLASATREKDVGTVTNSLEGNRLIASQENDVGAVTRGDHGLLVIGVTSRVDCLTLLEKRVKSRFSHRIMRIGPPVGLDNFFQFIEAMLCVAPGGNCDAAEEWKQLWMISVKGFLADKGVINVVKEIFAFGKDLRMLSRLLTGPVVALTPNSPWLAASHLASSVLVQRCPRRFPFLCALPYPHVALLIATTHTQAAGHEVFNFEMLFDRFMTQVRVSASAPVQIEGGVLGMVKVGRGVMMGAFEHLVATHVFQPVAAPVTHITTEFIRYRCIAAREDIKEAVEHLGQTHLKKWFSKNQ